MGTESRLALKSRYTRRNLFPLQEVGTAFLLLVCYFNVVTASFPPFPLRPRSLCSGGCGAAGSRECERAGREGEGARIALSDCGVEFSSLGS